MCVRASCVCVHVRTCERELRGMTMASAGPERRAPRWLVVKRRRVPETWRPAGFPADLRGFGKVAPHDQDSSDSMAAFLLFLAFPSHRMLEYSLDGHNVSLSAVRTVRVLRPLRAINRVPSEFYPHFTPCYLKKSSLSVRSPAFPAVRLSSSDFKLNSGCLVKALTLVFARIMFT